MHIHDTDIVHWLFGNPDQVSSPGHNVIPGSGYDIVTTNYSYKDGKVVNAQAVWTLEGDYGFAMTYRVNFERGNLVFENNQLKVNPQDGPDLSRSFRPIWDITGRFTTLPTLSSTINDCDLYA
jgi:predicted dehydrogenase